MHLVTSAGQERQELFKRVMAKDALNAERLEITFQAEGDNLKLAILDASGGGRRTMLKTPGRFESTLICARL